MGLLDESKPVRFYSEITETHEIIKIRQIWGQFKQNIVLIMHCYGDFPSVARIIFAYCADKKKFSVS